MTKGLEVSLVPNLVSMLVAGHLEAKREWVHLDSLDASPQPCEHKEDHSDHATISAREHWTELHPVVDAVLELSALFRAIAVAPCRKVFRDRR